MANLESHVTCLLVKIQMNVTLLRLWKCRSLASKLEKQLSSYISMLFPHIRAQIEKIEVVRKVFW